VIIEKPNKPDQVPRDNNRYYAFPYQDVFEASVYALEGMGLVIKYSSIYKGRIIAHRGLRTGTKGGYLDLRLIGMTKVTFVHVRVGSSTVSQRDNVEELRRRFYWKLDDWLHKAGPEERARVHEETLWAHGSKDRTWVPPNTAYRIDNSHQIGPTGPVVFSLAGPCTVGFGRGYPPGPPPG
jgi:hypothetical protein